MLLKINYYPCWQLNNPNSLDTLSHKSTKSLLSLIPCTMLIIWQLWKNWEIVISNVIIKKIVKWLPPFSRSVSGKKKEKNSGKKRKKKGLLPLHQNELRNKIGDEWMNENLIVYIEKNVFYSVDNESEYEIA